MHIYLDFLYLARQVRDRQAPVTYNIASHENVFVITLTDLHVNPNILIYLKVLQAQNVFFYFFLFFFSKVFFNKSIVTGSNVFDGNFASND